MAFYVIPVQTGIHFLNVWIPAFAGMTETFVTAPYRIFSPVLGTFVTVPFACGRAKRAPKIIITAVFLPYNINSFKTRSDNEGRLSI